MIFVTLNKRWMMMTTLMTVLILTAIMTICANAACLNSSSIWNTLASRVEMICSWVYFLHYVTYRKLYSWGFACVLGLWLKLWLRLWACCQHMCWISSLIRIFFCALIYLIDHNISFWTLIFKNNLLFVFMNSIFRHTCKTLKYL